MVSTVCTYKVLINILIRWDADYDYLRSDYFADYGADDYEEEKEVIVKDTFEKQNKENSTSFKNSNADEKKNWDGEIKRNYKKSF